MEQSTEPIVVGVRFTKVGKIYNFTADTDSEIKVGDMVVVETSRGWQLGQVAQVLPNGQAQVDGLKQIDRRATPRDLLLRQMWQMKESEVVSNCRARSTELRLAGIKIVSAEYSFDGSRLTILFSSETEEKYDLKSLRSDMQKMFAPSQVEMRQIGPRDVAKVVCGMGACGLETRCCCLFLTEFSSISIRMAKEQGISLTPTEITGMCGRLRCCLIYEYDTYVDARSKLPKRNKRVRTPQGEGKVVDVIPLRGSVLVDLPEVGVREFTGEEIALADDSGGPQPLPPFQGSRQPSEMDQSITGRTDEVPFTIRPDEPQAGPQGSEPGGPPSGERPQRGEGQRGDRPRGDRPPRTDRGPRPDSGPRADQPGRADQGPRTDQGPRQEPGGRPDRGPRPERGGRRQQPGRGQTGQPGRGQPGQSQGRPPGGPGGEKPADSRPPGDRPRRGPRREGRPDQGQGPQQGPQQGKPPSDSGPSAGNAPRGGKDSHRRRGRRRDSTSSDNET